MAASRSPVPRLDKLAGVLAPDAPHAAAAEPGGQPHSPARTSSASEASHPPAQDAHHSPPDPRRGSKSERKSPPRSPQARHHGKSMFGVPNLAPLSAIISGANGNHCAAKKPSSQTSRMKAVLRERATSRGMRRAGPSAEAAASSSPEPQGTAGAGGRAPSEAGQAAEQSGVPASGADSPPPLSPEPSSAVVPDAALLPMVTEEDIQRAFRYFAGSRGEQSEFKEQVHLFPSPAWEGFHIGLGC